MNDFSLRDLPEHHFQEFITLKLDELKKERRKKHDYFESFQPYSATWITLWKTYVPL